MFLIIYFTMAFLLLIWFFRLGVINIFKNYKAHMKIEHPYSSIGLMSLILLVLLGVMILIKLVL